MLLEPRHLEKAILTEYGLNFEAVTGIDDERQRWYELRPSGLSSDHTFAIRTTVGWRRIHIAFKPGKFAGELLSDMGNADEIGRNAFRAILADCSCRGADVDLRVNGIPFPIHSEELWAECWNRFVFSISKGQLELGADDGEPDSDIVSRWTGRFVAAITAILPIVEKIESLDTEVEGFPEGALITTKSNRYERDRRNRAAALSIHGSSCLACGINMGSLYGNIAEGFIEIHHITPVSQLGDGYVIDPRRDLVPLCPNCHSVAHRRTPPFSIQEIRQFLNFS